MGFSFLCIPADIDEKAIGDRLRDKPEELVLEIGRAKAAKVLAELESSSSSSSRRKGGWVEVSRDRDSRLYRLCRWSYYLHPTCIYKYLASRLPRRNSLTED